MSSNSLNQSTKSIKEESPRLNLDATRDLVKEKSDLRSELSKHTSFNKSNMAICIFHDEKSPSLYEKNGQCYCHGCKYTADIIKFVQDYYKKEYAEALLYLCAEYNIEPVWSGNFDTKKYKVQQEEKMRSIELLKDCHKKYIEALLAKNNEAALNYLIKERLQSLEIIKKWGLGFAPNNFRFLTPSIVNSGQLSVAVEVSISVTNDGKNYDFYHHGIIIPIHNESGVLVGFAMRSLPGNKDAPKYLNPKDSKIYHKMKYGLAFTKQLWPKFFPKINMQLHLSLLLKDTLMLSHARKQAY